MNYSEDNMEKIWEQDKWYHKVDPNFSGLSSVNFVTYNRIAKIYSSYSVEFHLIDDRVQSKVSNAQNVNNILRSEILFTCY